MGLSFAGCHISYVFVTNLFKTIHTASSGCSQLLETFSNSAIVLWTINNYNICQILSQCLYCLWPSSSTMIIVVTVVVIILINSITVVIVVVVINFFMSPLYLVAWSLAVVDNHHHHWQWQHHCHHHHHLLHVPPVLGRLVAGQPVHCFHCTLHLCQLLSKEKVKNSCLQKQGSKWWNFPSSTSFENPEILSSIASSVLTRMLGACRKTFVQYYARLNRRNAKVVLLPKMNLGAYFEKVLFGEDCTWTVVRKAVPTSGSLSALRFPWRRMWRVEVKKDIFFGSIRVVLPGNTSNK